MIEMQDNSSYALTNDWFDDIIVLSKYKQSWFIF